MGWEYLCSLNVPTYPDLVWEFYNNTRFGQGQISSKVIDIPILVTEEILRDALQIPNDGENGDHLENRNEGISTILNREIIEDWTEISANQLNAEMRLLHYMINKMFFPKIEKFDHVSKRDILVMHHVTQELPLNLPCLMLRYMEAQGQRKGASFPYGMVLTLVFTYFNLNLEGETKKELLSSDVYNDKSLKKMGFVKTEGKWTHKGKEIQDESGQDTPTPLKGKRIPTQAPPKEPPVSQPPPIQRPSDPLLRLEKWQLKAIRDNIITTLINSGVYFSKVHHLTNLTQEVKSELQSLRQLAANQQRRIAAIEEQLRTQGNSIQGSVQELKEEHTQFTGSIFALNSKIKKPKKDKSAPSSSKP